MALNTPAWWYKRGAEGAPWWRPALWPLSLVWRAVNDAKRAKAKPYRSKLFVISVGNLTLGGSGKTPITAEILRLLDGAVGLSKGYGGTLDGPVRVDPASHTASEVGDEPLMLARRTPFMIAKDRAAGLKALEGQTQIAVVDDAHQNLQIAKDLHVLVVDGDTRNGAWPFGDGGICPYGPLRESFGEGLARADIVVLWMPDGSAPDASLLDLLSSRPVFVARLVPQPPALTGPVYGFAGIAKPWKFEATLKALGLTIAGFEGFPDHAALSEDTLNRLAAKAGDAPLITTEKDWIKLSPAWRARITPLPIAARFDDEEGFKSALLTALDKAGFKR
ncbi:MULTISPECIES: tetraacyldisaccharide 4'-kinase [Asticcacaulis]|uniref:tetraacyldisaccharide 4'-kinase n=1 Tax=Asticcacaulis TaxID=76890 RepID=UPI001AE2A9A7|nr:MULTISPECIES: tetraacyldisaccharide 4'-kinase [Asticcacaulis]MBP2160641.1 tetraacyldisaccharide 4'-kinase [Asticcacaulis solisilvae]MDR6801686.1 tetraacyldisaccharide 4'-kinase [Asticcacaulis sp. BE141]